MKKLFILLLAVALSSISVSAQKKAVKSITINVDSLGSMDFDEVYVEFKDTSGVTGVTYTFNNFYMMTSPDSVTTISGNAQFRVVKAPPVKYRAILKEQVKAAEEEISREQKRNSDRIARKQEMDLKSKIKD